MEAKNTYVFTKIEDYNTNYDNQTGKIKLESFKCKVYQCQNKLFTELSEYKAVEVIYYKDLICSSCFQKFYDEVYAREIHFTMERFFREKILFQTHMKKLILKIKKCWKWYSNTMNS